MSNPNLSVQTDFVAASSATKLCESCLLLYYYYQFCRLGTGGFHKKAKPVRYVTQGQRGPIRNQMGQDTNKF